MTQYAVLQLVFTDESVSFTSIWMEYNRNLRKKIFFFVQGKDSQLREHYVLMAF
jgi:hypothetical protein